MGEGGRERERERASTLVSLLIGMLIFLDQGPTLPTHLTLITSIEANSPKTAILPVRASMYKF